MSLSALDSELTGPLFATAAMRAVFADTARVAAMLRVEAALATAEAAVGIVPKGLADAIAKLKPEDFDLTALGEKTADSGVATIPFVKALEAKLPTTLRPHVHRGPTSQDVIDTGLSLQMADAFALIAEDLGAILDGLARLARRHRRTVCVGRTYGQHAAPVTFGFVAGTWAAGIAEVANELPPVRSRALAAALGGPVGTLAAIGDDAAKVAARFANELGLANPPVPWHTNRARVVASGTWLATLIAALARMATDVAFLSSTEVGEVSEPHKAGRGGSSAMPHKRNPVSSAVILAAHAAAPGHVVTLLNAAASGQQRPTGLWQAEWHALPALFGLASGALREALTLAEGLVVDGKRMRANLDLTHGLIFADSAAAAIAGGKARGDAQALVTAAADRVRNSGRSLRDELAAAGVRKDALDAAFDLRPSIDAAAAVADRAIGMAQAARRILRKR